MSSNLSRSCICLNETRPSFKLPPNRRFSAERCLGVFWDWFSIFCGILCCFGKGGGLKRNIIQHKSHESSGNKERPKLTKHLLGEAIWRKSWCSDVDLHNTSGYITPTDCKIKTSTKCILVNWMPMRHTPLPWILRKNHSHSTMPRTRLASPTHASQQDGTENTLWAPKASQKMKAQPNHPPCAPQAAQPAWSSAKGIHRPQPQPPHSQQKCGKTTRKRAELPQQCSVTARLFSDMTIWGLTNQSFNLIDKNCKIWSPGCFVMYILNVNAFIEL